MCYSFLFAGNLNGYHQEWQGPTAMNRYGVAAFEFATVSVYSCDQLVVGSTQAREEPIDHLMTDVPDLERVAVLAPACNSDHASTLSGIISMAPAVPHLCVSRKVTPKHQINSNRIRGEIQDLPRQEQPSLAFSA